MAILIIPGASAGSVAHLSTPVQSDTVWIAVYNGQEVQAVIHGLTGELRAGDGIAVVMSSNSSDWGQDNQFAAALHRAFPSITLRAYLSLDGGTGKAGGLARTIGDLSPLFTQVSADWEVNGPVEFNPSYSATMTYFRDFAQIVQPTGRAAIGYPSGRGIAGTYAGAPDNWNYGAFATELNGMTIETQGLCAANGAWASAVSTVWAQYNASHLSTGSLSLQISLGTGGNGVAPSVAIGCANYWRHVDQGNLFFWWEMSQFGNLQTVLRAIGR